MALTGVLLAALLTYVVPNVTLEVQMGVLFWFSSLPVVFAGHGTRLVLPIGLFVLAYACWQADQRGWTGRYGHAAWHCLTSAAIPLLFLAQR